MRWRVDPGGFDLSKVDADSTKGAPGEEEATEAATDKLRARLFDLHSRLWAEHQRSLLVVVQAIDAGGKDGLIKKVFTGVNPQGCRVTSFKRPSEEELDHDFLWRVHKAVPAKGEIAVFNRSHYEDVLVVRVHQLVAKSEWKSRYGRIRSFEEHLTASGTTIVKLFLHISADEQARRFRARLEEPAKRWKFRTADLDERARWDDYQKAFEDALTKTTTKSAPWYCIPADHKWYRDWAAMSILVDTLEAMDPKYPEPEEDLDEVVIT